MNTYKQEGIWAFWRGSLPAFSGALSENAMAFGVNGLLTRVFDKYTTMGPESHTRSFLTGSITGFCTAFILCPADIVKCRAQLQRARGGTGNVKEIMRNIIQKDGLKGFYTGIHAQIARDIPFYFFFFGSYELCCSQLAFVHDEIQFECDPKHVDALRTSLVRSAAEAGEYYDLRIPIAAEAQTGNNWSEVH